MASNIDNTSTFRALAGFAAFLLVGAAALIYLQSGGGNPAAPKLAALSQVIPSQAARALGGDSAAFDVEAVASAAKSIESNANLMVDLSNALLDRSGSTAAIQEFQQRASRIRQTAASIPAGGESAVSAIAEDLGYLRNVANALNGRFSRRSQSWRQVPKSCWALRLVPVPIHRCCLIF